MGTITDNSGAVIPGATVTVTSVATGIEKKADTNDSGEYSVTYLAPGNYDVTVSANGFTSSVQKGIVLQINQQARVNVALKAGGNRADGGGERSTQPLLQSEDSSLGVVVGTESAANLPLNGRKFDDLAILTPGVSVYNPDNHTSTEDGAAINAYGAQLTWAQVNVDGVTMVNNRHAYVNMYPSVDAIQEFKVFTGNAEAEYGGGAGTMTNIQLKNRQPTLCTAMSLSSFATRQWTPVTISCVAPASQAGAEAEPVRRAPSAVPIIKDRTFFFFSYEGLRSVEQTAALTNVLTPAEENGDFSALLPGTQLVSPYTGTSLPQQPDSCRYSRAEYRQDLHAAAEHQPKRRELRCMSRPATRA